MMNNILIYLTLTLILTLQLSAADSLKLIQPNGGEVFEAGTTTDILWEGIPDTSAIEIKFSFDNGRNWNILFDSADGLSEQWTVPDIESDSCLVVVPQKYKASQNQPSIEWEKSYGDIRSNIGTCMIESHEGGFIIVGNTETIDTNFSIPKVKDDILIINVDTNGNLIWQETYGGTHPERAESIIQTNDKGYIIIGGTTSSDGDVTTPNKGYGDIWVFKIDKYGQILWNKTYGGSSNDAAYSIVQSNDGGYIIAGATQSNDGDITDTIGRQDMWVLKINDFGDLEWQKCYGGTGDESARSISKAKGSGYVITGYTWSKDSIIANTKGSSDYLILKINDFGDLEWQKTYGGESLDNPNSIIRDKNGGYLVVGSSKSKDGDLSHNNGSYDYWAIKLKMNGDLEWQKSFGGGGRESANSIIQAKDGGYIVIGSNQSDDGDITESYGNADYWIVKLNSNGDLEWQKSLGGEGLDHANSIIQTSEDSFIISGYSNSKRGHIKNNIGQYDCWVVKLSMPSDTSDTVFSIKSNVTVASYFVYDNNQSNSANAVVMLEEDTEITIEVFDVLGRRIVELYSGLATEGRNEYRIEYNDFQSGRYFVKLTTSEATKTEIIEILW